MRFVIALAAMLTTGPAIAQEADPTAAGRAVLPFAMAGMIAYVTRRMAIGGWLFYMYLGIILGAPITAVMAYPVIRDYFQPSLWYDTTTYLLGAASYLPLLAAHFAVFVLAVRLMFRSQRNRANAMALRYALLALLAANIAGTFIDAYYFENEVLLNIFSMVVNTIMCLYFFGSKRVKYVFDNWTGAWNYEDFQTSLSSDSSSNPSASDR